MDLLLINAHRYVSGFLPGSNLGMNILHQLLKKLGYSVKEFQGFAAQALLWIDQNMSGEDPASAIGFYCDFNNVNWVKTMASIVKQCYPSVRMFAGGPQTVGMDADFLRESGIEALCIGESEETLPELLEWLLYNKGRLADIKGIVYLGDDNLIHTNSLRTPPSNLDEIPWPDLSATEDYSQYPLLPILTGRGCPFGCTFCYEGANSKIVRHSSTKSVLNEIERNFKRNPEIKYINILDDTFTLEPYRVLEICEGIKRLRQKYDFVWFASAHIQTMYKHKGLAPAMAKAGVKKLFFGLESGDDYVLKCYNKHTNRQMIVDTLKHCVDSGIHCVVGNIIIGGPNETYDTIQSSVDMVNELMELMPGHFETAYFTFLPYPNTPITKAPDKFNMKILNERIDCCLEDIPLSETKLLSFNNILELRTQTNLQLQNKMKQIYQEGTIDNKTILETYRLYKKYGIYSRWLENVYRHYPIEHLYWTMIAGKQYCNSKDLNFSAKHCPVRTFEMWQYLKFDKNIFKINSDNLSELDFILLTFCNGRMPEMQVIQEAEKKLCNTISLDDSFYIKAKERLKTMENKKWIVYTKRPFYPI